MMAARRSFTRRARVRIFDACGGLCHICNTKVQIGQPWEIEHARPLALDGADDETNWRVAHVDCHRIKTQSDRRMIDKAARVRATHLGIRKAKQPIRGWRRFDGSPVRNPKLAKTEGRTP